MASVLTLQMHAQELFATPYFCQEQTEEHFKIAQVRLCNARPTEHVLSMLNTQRSPSEPWPTLQPFDDSPIIRRCAPVNSDPSRAAMHELVQG